MRLMIVSAVLLVAGCAVDPPPRTKECWEWLQIAPEESADAMKQSAQKTIAEAQHDLICVEAPGVNVPERANCIRGGRLEAC